MTYFYNQEINEVVSGLNASVTTGLTAEEEKRRLEEYGVREAFSPTAMDGKHWIATAMLSLLPIFIVDIFKLLKINRTKNDI